MFIARGFLDLPNTETKKIKTKKECSTEVIEEIISENILARKKTKKKEEED